MIIKKFMTKFVSDILPSVAATVIGAYVVTHYINKPAAPPPVPASAPAAEPNRPDAIAAPNRAAKAARSEPAELAGLPDASSAKVKTDKPVADRPEKSADKPAEKRGSPPTPRDKTAKAGAATAAPPDATPAPDERRDANELARAAIERLRGSGEPSHAETAPRVAAVNRAPELSRSPDTPPSAPPLQPAVTVNAPAGSLAAPVNPAATAPLTAPEQSYPVVRIDDPRRPSPPAEIPMATRPIDLHAEAATGRTTVTEDVLSAAKSVFHAVVPR